MIINRTRLTRITNDELETFRLNFNLLRTHVQSVLEQPRVLTDQCFFIDENPHAPSIMALCQICVYANSASNPLIYNAVNEQFREGFKNYFRSWIECVLKIKGSKRRDHIQIAVNRRNRAKPMGSCTMCRSGSETSINGTLCPQTESQVNNNHRDDITQSSGVDTKVISPHHRRDECEEFLTTV